VLHGHVLVLVRKDLGRLLPWLTMGNHGVVVVGHLLLVCVQVGVTLTGGIAHVLLLLLLVVVITLLLLVHHRRDRLVDVDGLL